MKVTGICVHPIKATRAICVEQAEVRPRGLTGDRRWVVVDQHGQFISQRSHPKLALVTTVRLPDGAIDAAAPGMQPLRIGIPSSVERLTAVVWDDTVDAACAGSEAAAWFSEFVGVACRLAYMDQAAHRPVATQYGQDGDVVSFADAAPLLMATDASLADLNRRLRRPLPMSRFRPNVTIDGTDPWEEDRWKRLRIGNVEFEVTHRCARCVVTTIDQETGEVSADGEPLKTLATFRRDSAGVHFGENLVPRGVGTIEVGDQVVVLTWND